MTALEFFRARVSTFSKFLLKILERRASQDDLTVLMYSAEALSGLPEDNPHGIRIRIFLSALRDAEVNVGSPKMMIFAEIARTCLEEAIDHEVEELKKLK